MKTIEEKAKAYDEALERAKAYHRNELTGSRKEMIEYIFPQLCESEDEKIRKKLVQFLTDVKNISEDSRNSWAVRKGDAEMCATFLAYLEKQKEKNPTSFNEPYNPDEYEVVMEGNATSLRHKWQKSAEWSEEDEKMRNLAIEWAETMSGQCSFVDMDSTDFRKIVTWLKSLRPSWKPSKEEMQALDVACSGKLWYGHIYLEGLKRIREQLKKL